MEKEEKKRTSIKGEKSKSIQPKCVDMEETEICIIKKKYPPSPNQQVYVWYSSEESSIFCGYKYFLK